MSSQQMIIMDFTDHTFDSVNPTYDSTMIDKFENIFSWTNSDNAKQQLLTFNFALKHMYTELSVDSAKKIYNQLIPSGEVTFSISDKLKLDFYGDMVFGNSYVGNYKLSGKLSFFSRFGDLDYTITSTLQDVDRIYQNYSSNHFFWSNSLKKESYFVNTINYRYKNLIAGFSFTNVGNFVYYDTLGIPAQLDGSYDCVKPAFGKGI